MHQSSKSAKMGDIKLARRQGMIAAYLNFVAIVLALVVALVVTALVVGIYGKDWSLNKCLKKGIIKKYCNTLTCNPI